MKTLRNTINEVNLICFAVLGAIITTTYFLYQAGLIDLYAN